MKKKICTRCVMDSTVANISFDNEGVCNFCTEFLERSGRLIFHTDHDNRRKNLTSLVSRLKQEGKGKKYDCLVGISGGVDSSWVLVKAVELGLRPLAVHMDNGWNSELAQSNIECLVNTLGVDLYTHVIEWDEYRQLMQCFFDANVIDIELLYDNAMLAVNYHQAAKFGIKSILAGTNQATEGMKFPANWNHLKFDRKNIFSIAKRFGPVKIKTFPSIGTLGFVYHSFFKKRKWVSFLDMIEFNKEEALKELEKNYGYRRYLYKHYESIFTRFYQGYLLLEKFGVDKRMVHLSTLVAAMQMNRDVALKILDQISYPSEADLEKDKQYFLKKMMWTQDDLDHYLAAPRREHFEYGSEEPLYNLLKNFYFTLTGKQRNAGIER